MTFSKTGVCKAGLSIACIVSLAACASTPDPVIGAAASTPISQLGQANYSQARSTTYLLRPSDQISVNVFREPDFTMDNVRIGVEGNVSLPMLGSIPAAGMTAADFEKSVAQRLEAAGLRVPMVSVNINEYASHLVTVEGAVDSPGVYAFQPGSRLSAAIAMGGGPTRSAKSEQVAVFRESPEGIMVAKFDFGQINQGTMLDPVLEPGDRVVIGTDGLSVFWQDFLRTIPAFGIFANLIK
ncbi:MAG: polysaccharide biosynthesis/export family protein [Pseudomonadota bacterium]